MTTGRNPAEAAAIEMVAEEADAAILRETSLSPFAVEEGCAAAPSAHVAVVFVDDAPPKVHVGVARREAEIFMEAAISAGTAEICAKKED